MKQMEVSKWLKGICIAIAIAGIFFFLLIVPMLGKMVAAEKPELAFLFWPELIHSWIIGVLTYLALYKFYTVCVEIGKDNSFSRENARAFGDMSKIIIAIVALWFVRLLLVVVFGWVNVASALFFILEIFVGVVAAILTAALSHLILNAYEMRQENDLTI